MPYTLEMREQFTVARDPKDIFDYITDFSRISEWDHTIVSSKKTTMGTIGKGTAFDVLYAMGPRKSLIEYKISNYHPNQSAVLVGISNTFTATDVITIEQHDDACKVTWHASIEFSGAASKIVPLIKNKVIKAGTQTIKDLAVALQDNYPLPKLNIAAKTADKLILPGLAGFTKFGYRLAQRHWKPVTNSVNGQHIVITGATSGLGLATAHALAHRGVHLTLVARDSDKAKAVVQQLIEQTGNEQISVELTDLAEIDQVIDLSQRLLKYAKPIDVLINNAGALLNERTENSDGLEVSLALLLLGPVILTECLKPLLKQASNKGAPSRVINVSSGGMYAKRIAVSNLESNKGDYSGADAYARAKRGLVIAGECWAEQWSDDNIVVHSMHPGWAQTPGVKKSLPEFNRKMQITLRSAQEGADTIIWLACATEATKATGLFWLDRVPHSTHLTNKTRETSAQRQALLNALRDYAARYDVKLELGS